MPCQSCCGEALAHTQRALECPTSEVVSMLFAHLEVLEQSQGDHARWFHGPPQAARSVGFMHLQTTVDEEGQLPAGAAGISGGPS